MKKTILLCTHLLIVSFLVAKLDCSPIQALEDAKKQLEAGIKSIANGKQGVMDGYNYIESSLDTMSSAADGIGKQMIELDKEKSIVSDMLKNKLPELLGIATAAGVIFPVLWALTLSIPPLELTLMDFPKTFGGINSTLSSIVDTLRGVVNTITPANEKLDPKNMIALLKQGDSEINNIKNKIQDNASWINSNFKNTLNSITDTITQQIHAAQSNIDPIKEKSRDIKTMEDLAAKMKDQNATLDGAKDAINKKTSLENYFLIKDDKGADIDENTRKDRIAKITDILNGLAGFTDDSSKRIGFLNDFKAQITRDKNNENIPLVYQKFNSADQKFDAAIKKIDGIITTLQQIAEEI